MTSKKFYQNKEFLKIRNKWYKKLESSGFEDLEWYNPNTGMGQGSPYLKSASSPTLGSLRKNYSQSSQAHYRLCRNFLHYGGFYTILKENYSNNLIIKAIYDDSASKDDKVYAIVTQSILAAAQAAKESKAAPASPALPSLKDILKASPHDIILPSTHPTKDAIAIKDLYPNLNQYLLSFDSYYTKADSILWQMYCDGLTIRDISKELRKEYKSNRLSNPAKRKSSKPFSVFWVKHRIDELRAESAIFNLRDERGLNYYDEAGEAGEEGSI